MQTCYIVQGDSRSGYFPKECVREELECIGALDWCEQCLAERENSTAGPSRSRDFDPPDLV